MTLDSHDLRILDAFSSDAIPVHLITREVLMVYQQALAAVVNRFRELRKHHCLAA